MIMILILLSLYPTSFLESMAFPLAMSFIVLKMKNNMKNTLMLFLTLEVLMLNTFMVIILDQYYLPLGGTFFMVFFTLAVCEASMGLALLVKMMRYKNSSSLSLILHISLMKPLAFKAKIIMS